MPDPVQSIANSQHTPALGTPAPSPTLEEADPRPSPKALSGTVKAEEPLYSIRGAESPGTCAACGKQETGTGPVGYFDEEPVCDLCLLEHTTDLGMILALVSVVRAFGSLGTGTPEEHQEALEELGAFARIYHRIASKSWPVRLFPLPDSIIRLRPDGEGS